MRYFTMALWVGAQSEEDQNWDRMLHEYEVHLDAIRKRLPPGRRATLDTLETVAAHDARLIDLRLDAAAGTLLILLDAYWAGGKLSLAYSGLCAFRTTADAERGFPGAGYGDLGYWEVDLSADGDAFVHRILFSSGIEFEIEFTGPFEFRQDGTTPPG